ncbi:MAG: AraC family transcriptional regulator [Oxalobacteraceae bacterium]|nr:MAG: AraC family transcriptional regulator [Oxalobacteraceae bacterium]
MIVHQRQASASLKSIVRSFAERQAQLGADVVTSPLPARPDQFIEFYLQDRYRISHDDGAPSVAPTVVVVGPQGYRRTRLILSGSLHVFTIRFQPGGFNALFGIPMTTLVNEGVAIGDVIGEAATGLRDGVMLASDFDGRVSAAEHWLKRTLDVSSPIDRVARSAAALQRAGGRLSIRTLACRAELSDRQFTRRFEQQVGLTPKLFARTIRLNAVLEAKVCLPSRTWTDLVHEAGYADQAHFVRDCRALAGSAPASFFAEWAQGR